MARWADGWGMYVAGHSQRPSERSHAIDKNGLLAVREMKKQLSVFRHYHWGPLLLVTHFGVSPLL